MEVNPQAVERLLVRQEDRDFTFWLILEMGQPKPEGA